MNLQSINASNASYNNASTEQKQTIERVQTEFLSQINKGKGTKEAFKESLKAIDKKYNPQNDEFEKSSGAILGDTVGNGQTGQAKIDNVMKIMEVIAFAIPIIENFVDWILEKIPTGNNKSDDTISNCVA